MKRRDTGGPTKHNQEGEGKHHQEGPLGTLASGLLDQGGAVMPYIVCKSALKMYYDTL